MSPKSESFPAFKTDKPTGQRTEDDFFTVQAATRPLQDSMAGSAIWHEFSIHDHYIM